MMEGFIATVTLVAVFGLGWVVGNSVVANECRKLGSFYVGSVVYECKVKGGA